MLKTTLVKFVKYLLVLIDMLMEDKISNRENRSIKKN